jgi:F420-dependent oxidoreductase-like protein
MRYGIGLDTSKPVAEIVEDARRFAGMGFQTLNAAHIFSYDALVLLGQVGAHVPDVELMTAVLPIFTRHPITMAQQALTVQAATEGRFVLGIGLSHQIVAEAIYGGSYARPVRAMTEYLSAMLPLLRGESVSFEGETVKAVAGLEVKPVAPVPVIVAALGTKMLQLTGAMADGTATWMTGRKTLADHIVPTITAAAEQAGRPAPRICAALPVAVTADAEAARARAGEIFALYGHLPSYRAMLDREGAASPADVTIAGTEEEVSRQLEELAEAGVTDFAAAPIGTREEVTRTLELLSSLAKA